MLVYKGNRNQLGGNKRHSFYPLNGLTARHLLCQHGPIWLGGCGIKKQLMGQKELKKKTSWSQNG